MGRKESKYRDESARKLRPVAVFTCLISVWTISLDAIAAKTLDSNKLLRSNTAPVLVPDAGKLKDNSVKPPRELTLRLTELEMLSAQQKMQLRCRIAKISLKQAPIRAAMFTAINATPKILRKYEDLQGRLVREACSDKADISNEVSAIIQDQGNLLDPIMRRFSKGSLLPNEGSLAGMTAEIVMERFKKQCFEGSERFGISQLAKMPEADFNRSLPNLAFGKCSGNAGAAVGNLPPSINAGGSYGQCVQEALRNAAMTSIQECGGIAGQCSDEGANCTPEEYDAWIEEGRRQAAREEAVAQAQSEEAQENRTAVLMFLGAAAEVAVVGACIASGGCAALVVTLGLAIAGAEATLGGAAVGRAAERRREVRGYTLERQCPAVLTAVGALTFSSSPVIPGGRRPAKGERLTVVDAIRACACENNPIDKFTKGIPGMEGGTCNNSKRLRCLREAAVNDLARPMSFECRQALKEDNSNEVGDMMTTCGVVNCGPAATLNSDCGCYPRDKIPSGLKVPAGRCQIQCMEGYKPTVSGCACAPDGELLRAKFRVRTDLRDKVWRGNKTLGPQLQDTLGVKPGLPNHDTINIPIPVGEKR